MKPLHSFILLALSVAPSAFAGINLGNNQNKMRGVNLGGWLVLEPWITPSLFERTGNTSIIDEYTFGEGQDRDAAKTALKNHWDTWITEKDFEEIRAAGLTHVRVPIGYWAYDISNGEPYIQGQIPYLNKAIGWAEQYRLKFIVDLHGAPGSQNGFDNSGQKLPSPTWHKDPRNIERTVDVIKTIADTYGRHPSVSIAPLNEPAGFKGDDLVAAAKQYWESTYRIINKSGAVSVIHDAFKGPAYWNGQFPPEEYHGLVMDTHIYQMFSYDEVKRSDEEHIQAACDLASNLEASDLPVIVGEWTAGATDCAKWLNGRNTGARYDGTFEGTQPIGVCSEKTGKASGFSKEYKEFLGKYWEAQRSTYEEAGQGWIQWTWKTEIADEWSYQAGLEHGWIPRNPNQSLHPGVCVA